MTKVIGIIPARYASSRFPGKPLVTIKGKTMIRRVYEQARKSGKLSGLYVATDDERIANEVQTFGGECVMTSSDLPNGTARCAAVARNLECDFVINIQGDEPAIDPRQIDQLADLLNPDVEIATLVRKFTSPAEIKNSSTAKVVLDEKKNAIYFSRSVIPFPGDLPEEKWISSNRFLKHVGLYGYKKDVLLEIVKLPVEQLESAESLEQLRWIAHGFRISTGETPYFNLGIDTPEDLDTIMDYIHD